LIQDTGPAILCPACGSTQVRHAYRRAFLDPFAILALRRPWRCQACRHRFYLPFNPLDPKKTKGAPIARLAVLIALVVLSVYAFFRFISSAPAP